MKRTAAIAILLASASLPVAAFAQDASTAPAEDQGGIADIVVTAQKRAENVQDIPLAITAVSGDTLAERQVTGVDALATIAPSVNFGTYGGSARIAVRGIGFDTVNPGAEGRIAYHVDGVYISRPGAQLGTFFDVERVEVLRGPQGTLYGRNATGGSINVITRQPTREPSGYANLTVGNFGRVAVDAALSGALTDGVSARIAVMSNNRGGYGKNEFTGNDIDDANQRGARVMLRLEPTEALTIDLSGDYYRENDHAYGIHYFGQYSPAIPLRGVVLGGHTASRLRNINSEFDPKNDRELYGFSGTATLDLGDVTLKSITAYRHSDYRVLTELDQTELPLTIFPFFERAHQFSEELQLSGKFGRSNWIVGGYYFKENIYGGSQVTRNLAVVGGPNRMTNGYRAEGETDTEAMAIFGQIDFALTDAIKLIAGARYNHETIDIRDQFQLDFVRDYSPTASLNNLPGFPRSATTSNNAFTPKLGVEYNAGNDLLLYATVSKGFKSGGFNLGVNVPAFSPEKIWAYEGGVKFTTADRALRANLAGFYYDYKNLQVSKVINSQVITENAASASLYGAELELTAIPVEGLQLDGTLSYLHSEYKDFVSADPGNLAAGPRNLAGNQLTQAPKFTMNAGMQYSWPSLGGELTLRGEANHVSRVYFTAFNVNQVSQAANTKFNAFLTYRSGDDHWSGTLFARNITDKVTRANGLMSSAVVGAPVTGSVSAPRTFGATIGYRF
jgi:iron complex outermembrane receptor protein